MRHHAFAALIAAGFALPHSGLAATAPGPFAGNLFVSTNCISSSPVGSTSGTGPTISDSCSDADSSARARASFTSLGVDAQGVASAGGMIFDAMKLDPADTSLIGTVGKIVFGLTLDGTLRDAMQLRFQAFSNNGFASTGANLSYNFDVTGPGGTSTISGSRSGSLFINGTAGDELSYDGTIDVSFDVVFGEYLSYQFTLDAFGFSPTSSADFYSTAAFSTISAFDTTGAKVGLSGATTSGTDLSPYLSTTTPTVPLPASAMLLLGALGAVTAVGSRHRVRIHAHHSATTITGRPKKWCA